ncbi:MAG: flagellar basal body rod C-terminal domain-containing protein, partial [Bacillota bacterium]
SADNAAAFTIRTAGGVLVSGNTANLLETYQNTDGLYDVRWQDAGDAFTPAGGSLKAYLDLRDGTGIDGGYQGIPYYTAQLNEFARTLAAAFNEGIYADGADYGNGHADGYGTNGQTGIRFFSYDKISSADLQAFLDGGATMDEVYSNITAANISLSSDIYDDLGHIAAASAAGEEANNEIVNSLISMLQDNKMFNKGTPEDFMNSLVATLGTNSASAQRMADNQATIVKRVGDRRTSVSGVSTNEETANLTIYEQAYEASSQVVSVWNEVYAVTINLISD